MVLTIKKETVPPWDYRGALSPATGPDLPGLARRRALLGACAPLIGPRGKPSDYHLYPPYIKCPARKFFQKIIQPVFVPEKPRQNAPAPAGPQPKISNRFLIER
jgi:hypothetical protein